ncbi:hypothetical protein [Streptomyces sp. CB01881]|uniref:hypothetical protein n=1 Tax=Streptomyces sp. CB01881 TaxID=2078691 RepID=UPI000CDCD233|nr:hypothetical protein [Streptomyces sp. CB01881]AUY48237.1 hypothetical protein C2142_03855 [Streptomyces sp. CB01881]TYC76727.1 hypothetical protein EH183_03865 [Streptomyces sp. CB01881]
MDEIGRAGWVAIGVAGMALAGAAHAVVGAEHIMKELLRSPEQASRDSRSAGSEAQGVSGPGGWILLGSLLLAAGAVAHVVGATGTIVKEVLHVTAR